MMSTRYYARGVQAAFEPGSRGRVVRNLLGITRVRDMKEAESQALQIAQEQAVERYAADHRFRTADICDLHRDWLGPIYQWGGEFRSVDLTKGGLMRPRFPD